MNNNTLTQESTEFKNQRFEELLVAAANDYLKPELRPDDYANFTLTRLWNGDTFVNDNGDCRYHEIGSKFTIHGETVIVSYR